MRWDNILAKNVFFVTLVGVWDRQFETDVLSTYSKTWISICWEQFSQNKDIFILIINLKCLLDGIPCWKWCVKNKIQKIWPHRKCGLQNYDKFINNWKSQTDLLAKLNSFHILSTSFMLFNYSNHQLLTSDFIFVKNHFFA